MVDDSKEKIVAKIMKMMELGREDKNSNPNERENALRMAAKLMAEWSIDFVDLRNGKPNDSAFVTFEVEGSVDEKVDYEALLAGSIAEAFDCKVINSWGTNGMGWVLKFCGTKHDLEIVVFFFKYLRRTMYAMANKNVTLENTRIPYGRKRVGPRDVAEAQRNYCYGMVTTIGDRLTELYKKREEYIPSDCRALVVVKKEGVEKYYRDQFPNARSSRVRRLSGDLGAHDRGKADGRNVNLSRPIANNGGGAVHAQIQ
jgi:hypothetical protein